MRSFLQLPFIRHLHQRHLLLPTVVGAAVLAVLLHGAFTHEREAEASAGTILALPIPPSLPDLRPNLEKTPLTYLSDYYLQLGDQAKNKLVLVGQEKLPGLVVTPGVILTSIRAADESMRVRLQQKAMQELEARQSPAREAEPSSSAAHGELLVIEVAPLDPEASPERMPVIAADAELGVALLEMEQPYIAAPFSPVDPAVLAPGSVVLAVTLLPDERLDITPGYLTSPGAGESTEDNDPLHVSVSFPRPPPVAAIVDLDGRLVGVAVETPAGGTHLLSSNQVLRAVDRLREGTPCRAIEVSDLSETAKEVLQLNGGVLVEEVRDEAFRPEPSILPGDFLLQWNGEEVSTADQFYALYDNSRPAALVRYRVLRDQKRVSGATVMPGPDCRPVPSSIRVLAALGLTVRWTAGPDAEKRATAPEGWRVLSVTPESPASSAGVEPGDLVVALNGVRLNQTRGEQQLLAAEKSPRPFVLTLRRGGRVTLATIEREPAAP